MMWKEFEEIAGYEVSYETYNNVIEPMYTALPNISKQEFVKLIDKKAVALPTRRQVINQMKKLANHLYEICGHYTDYKTEEKLDKLAKEYAKRFHGINWSDDMKSYVFFIKGYEYEEVQRGCTYFKELVIGRQDKYGFCNDYERIQLVK